MKEPVRSILAHPGTMARDAFLLSFFYPFVLGLSFSLSLIRLHRKSELPFVCNGESRKGEGARSTASEEGEGEEEAEERGDEKGPESGVGTKEGDEEEDAVRRRIYSSPISSRLFPLYFILSLFLSPHPSFFVSRRCPFLILDLFRASTIYLRASNKKK